MPKKEVPVTTLGQYLPPGTLEPVLDYLHRFHVHLTVTRERKSVLGDYRHRTHNEHHRISVNGNLNSWAFLVTLLHELAHLLTFEKHSNRVQAHGAEWKKIYGELLHSFLQQNIFPPDIKQELQLMLHNPGASSCAEDGLVRVLRRYNPGSNKHRLIEELPVHAVFAIADGRIFIRGEKLRKRYKCVEKSSGRVYLFSPVYEVEIIEN